MNEEWRPVAGFEDLYEVSNTGKVRSICRTIFKSEDSFKRNKEPIHREFIAVYKSKELRPYCVRKKDGKVKYHLHRRIHDGYYGQTDTYVLADDLVKQAFPEMFVCNNKRALVLSSGGCDSTTLVSLAVKEFGAENVVTVSVAYGQKHSRELKSAEAVAKYYNLRHEVIDLSAIFKYSNCSLLQQSTEDVPEGSYEEQINKSKTGVVSTYVPYRNGLMLSAIASLGLSMFPDSEVHIYLGAHADDAAGNAYPDCSVAFTETITEAIRLGTDGQVIVDAPLVNMNKAQVVKLGLKLKTPYQLTTSCYNGGKKACGVCGTCTDRIAAFKANHKVDPIPYAIKINWEN